MSVTTRALAQLVTQAARTLGVPPPAAFTEQLDAANQLVTAAHNIHGADKLRAAVLAALAEGRDYHADKEIGRLLLDAVLSDQLEIGIAARDRSVVDIEAALFEHADALLTGWADALEPHSQALAAAAAALPNPNLDDYQAVVARGPKAMQHWAAAQEAVKQWKAATDGFRGLASAARITVDKRSPHILTAADIATIGQAQATAMREGKQVDAWILARHAVPPRLPTLGEYMERVAMHEQQRQAAARRAHGRHEEERSVLA
jgi:hypothetical protein